MLRSFLLATITVLGGLAAVSIVFSIVYLLMNFVDYKKKYWDIQIKKMRKDI